MSKYFIFWTLLLVPFLCSSCGDDDVIRDVDLAQVSLKDGKSLIFGKWFMRESGCFGHNYYLSRISAKGIQTDNDYSQWHAFHATEWTKVSNGIQAKGYRYDEFFKDKVVYDSIVFCKIMNRKLYVDYTPYSTQRITYFTKEKDE